MLNADGAARLFLAPEKISRELESWLGDGVRVQAPDELPRLATRFGRSAHAHRSDAVIELVFRGGVRRRHRCRAARRSVRHAAGMQECGGNCGRQVGARARRRCAHPFPALGGHGGRSDAIRRNRCRRNTGVISRGNRCPEGHFLRHHRRRRLPWRLASLSPDATAREADRTGLPVVGRLRSTVSRWYDRCDSNRRDRRADSGDARAIHGGARRPPGARPRALSRGYHRIGVGCPGASGAVDAWAGLRSWHRPRSRLLSRCP